MRAASALFLLLLLGGCKSTPEVPIFLFHSVGEESGDPRDVSNEEFEEELSLIDQFHATPVTLRQLFDAREKGTPLPKRPVVLTFDDGRASLYAHAFPALKKHHAVAELFVVTGWVSGSADSRARFKDETGEFPTMTWPELAELSQSGVMIIESHSVTHPRLASLDPKQQLEELTHSRAELRERLKVPCDFFAYPAGSLGAETKDLVKQAGYRGAVAVEAHGGGPYGLTRVSVWRASVPRVREALVSAFGALP